MSPVYIFLAGGTGALARWGLTKFINQYAPSFPLGVLTCNLIGCFLIGACAGCIQKPSTLSLTLTVGFLGGFTTFSSFALDSLKFIENQNWGAFFLNSVGSVVLGITLCGVGYSTSQLIYKSIFH